MKRVTAEQLIEINKFVIQSLSPKEFCGVKDYDALDMVVNKPYSYFQEELYPSDIKKMAVLFGSVLKKHVFHNGNKRTATVALMYYAESNGYTFSASNKDVVRVSLDYVTDVIGDSELEGIISKWVFKEGNLIKSSIFGS